MRHARIDTNQPHIVLELARRGWTVQSLAGVGYGCPDLLVGADGVNVLLEVKDGARAASEQRLTRDQEIWHSRWRGQVAVVRSEREAVIAVLTAIGESLEHKREPIQAGD